VNAPDPAARLVLGIETSCDDTSVAVLEDGRTLRSHLIAAQDVHRLYGGVVPELASCSARSTRRK
jgi:N6-L-threonylcarbamoyladenine synthase